MPGRPLSAKERRELEESGFDLAPRPHRRTTESHRLGATVNFLKLWGAKQVQIRAILAAPSASTLRRWQSGESAPIPLATCLRVDVVLGIYHCLVEEVGFEMDLPPLPEMSVPGRHRRRQPALEVIQSGRLSDLIALWLQLVRAAERWAQRERRKR